MCPNVPHQPRELPAPALQAQIPIWERMLLGVKQMIRAAPLGWARPLGWAWPLVGLLCQPLWDQFDDRGL